MYSGRIMEDLENLQRPCPAGPVSTHDSFAGMRFLCAFDRAVMQWDFSNVKRRIREFGSLTSY